MGIPDPDVRRWTGVSASVVGAALGVEVVAKLTMGVRPDLDQSDALIAYVEDARAAIITVILADTVLMTFLIVFLGSFRQLVNRRQPAVTWIADVMFGAGLVFIAVTLVGDALDGGTALDVMGLEPDPSVIRALIEGHVLMFGSIGSVLLALGSGPGAYLTFLTGALPRWTGVPPRVPPGSPPAPAPGAVPAGAPPSPAPGRRPPSGCPAPGPSAARPPDGWPATAASNCSAARSRPAGPPPSRSSTRPLTGCWSPARPSRRGNGC